MLNARTIRIDPRKIKLLDLNAHYMRHEVFARLVDNLREDGGLYGDTPFAWRLHDDTTQQPVLDADGQPIYEVLSGNHRVKASVAAELAEIDLTITDDYLPPDRRRALQLARNAVVGEDDPATLKLIYDSIGDTGLKLYTGLDDSRLKLMEGVQIAALSEAGLQFQTIALTFLPHELDQVQTALERARKATGAKGFWLAAMADYDRALDALEAAGQAYNVRNTATSLMLILNIFMQHMDELQAGYLDAEGEAVTPKQQVPVASVLNSLTIPAATAAKLKKKLAALDADPVAALAKLLEGAE